MRALALGSGSYTNSGQRNCPYGPRRTFSFSPYSPWAHQHHLHDISSLQVALCSFHFHLLSPFAQHATPRPASVVCYVPWHYCCSNPGAAMRRENVLFRLLVFAFLLPTCPTNNSVVYLLEILVLAILVTGKTPWKRVQAGVSGKAAVTEIDISGLESPLAPPLANALLPFEQELVRWILHSATGLAQAILTRYAAARVLAWVTMPYLCTFSFLIESTVALREQLLRSQSEPGPSCC